MVFTLLNNHETHLVNVIYLVFFLYINRFCKKIN